MTILVYTRMTFLATKRENKHSRRDENYFSLTRIAFRELREKTNILKDTRITFLGRELLLEKFTKNGQSFWTTRIAFEKSNSRRYTPRIVIFSFLTDENCLIRGENYAILV